MEKTIFSQQEQCLRELLIALRKEAGLTQRQLAQKLRRERSLVGRLELGERRLDVVELYWFCKACGTDPKTFAGTIMQKLDAIDTKKISK